MKIVAFLLLSLAPLSAFALAQKPISTTQSPVFFAQKDMTKWGTPQTLPPGAMDLVLHGNPSKPGIFTIRLKLPAGYKIPAYTQSAPTFTTVISGNYCIGVGEKFDTTQGTCIAQGGFIILPANTTVYSWTTEPTIIQLNGEGPLKISK